MIGGKLALHQPGVRITVEKNKLVIEQKQKEKKTSEKRVLKVGNILKDDQVITNANLTGKGRTSLATLFND